MDNSDVSWRKYGDLDPYFGVITDPRFERKNLTEKTLEEFFAGGEEHVEGIFRLLHARVRPDFMPSRALDYGCGVGRVLVPLARRCGHVTGVDIAEGMLKEAETNCRLRKISNVSLALADDGLSRISGAFELIHSFIVFQHIPAARGEAIISALIEQLVPGGIAVLHVPYLRDLAPLKRFVDWARARSMLIHMAVNVAKRHPLNRPVMQMNAYDINHLFRIFQRKSCNVLYVDFLNNTGNWGAVLYIQKHPSEQPC